MVYPGQRIGFLRQNFTERDSSFQDHRNLCPAEIEGKEMAFLALLPFATDRGLTYFSERSLCHVSRSSSHFRSRDRYSIPPTKVRYSSWFFGPKT
jgi:hypothetical protein